MEPHIIKLPLWSTVKAAYRLAWSNRLEYIKISRWWLLLAVPATYIYNWLIWPKLQPTLCLATITANAKQHVPFPHNLFFLTAPLSFFIILFGASIAVAWHRLILRNEHVGKTYLRFDKVVWSYFLFGAFLRLLPMISVFLSLNTTNLQSNPGLAAIKGLVSFILAITTLLITIRLSVMLPAKALAENEITIKDVWQKTRSNFWRLCIGTILCALPVGIVSIFIQPGCYNNFIGITLYTFSLFLYVIVALPVVLSFLSLAYKHFFEESDPVI